MLPTSSAGSTISARLDVPNLREDTTPAILALNQAFKDGIISADALIQGFNRGRTDRTKRQLADEELQNSKNRMALSPAEVELRRKQLEAELAILPSKVEVAKAQNLSALEILPKKTRNVGLSLDADSDLIPKKAQLAGASLDADIGLLPKKTKLADDNLDADLETLPDEVELKKTRIDREINDPTMGKKFSPAQKEFADYFAAQNRPELIYRPDGSIKSIPELAEAAKQLRENPPRKALTPLQQSEEEQALVTAQGLLGEMDEVEKMLGGDINAVGPLAGSIVGRAVTTTRAGLGSDDSNSKRNVQRKLEMFANSLTAEKTKALKGSLSEKELRFIQASVPQMSDDEAVWKDYLSHVRPILEKAISAREAALSQDSTPAATPANASNLPLISTQAEYDALDVGLQYRTADGTVATKRK